MRTVHVLANPASRSGSRDGERVRNHLAATGLGVIPILTTSPEDVAPAIAAASDIERLIIVGGDGLVHHALPTLVNSTIETGIVPSGTGNDFARSLGIPNRWKPAADRAVGDVQSLDVLRIERTGHSDRYAATVLMTGFSGRVNATANTLRFPKGQQKYTVATLIEARRLEAIDVTLRTHSVDGSTQTMTGPATFLAVGNTAHFGGGMAICPEAQPDDGALHLTFVDEVSRISLLRMLPTVFPGRHVRHPAVHQAVGTVMDVDTTEDIWADGELVGPGPVRCSILPGALRLAAPASA